MMLKALHILRPAVGEYIFLPDDSIKGDAQVIAAFM
jgi:hypothetical protein